MCILQTAPVLIGISVVVITVLFLVINSGGSNGDRKPRKFLKTLQDPNLKYPLPLIEKEVSQNLNVNLNKFSAKEKSKNIVAAQLHYLYLVCNRRSLMTLKNSGLVFHPRLTFLVFLLVGHCTTPLSHQQNHLTSNIISQYHLSFTHFLRWILYSVSQVSMFTCLQR